MIVAAYLNANWGGSGPLSFTSSLPVNKVTVQDKVQACLNSCQSYFVDNITPPGLDFNGLYTQCYIQLQKYSEGLVISPAPAGSTPPHCATGSELIRP